ncbi:MAG: hypothetical protein NTX49_10485 [Chlamydiae bacterium]|nr:hypothetical protein [Chlamydiota bacterium]
MTIGIKPAELTPTQTRTLTSLRNLIKCNSINNYSIDVRITDNLEIIPSWNIIARIWNRSHLDSSKVSEALLNAVQDPQIINKLKETGELEQLFFKEKYMQWKFSTTKVQDRRETLIENFSKADAIFIKAMHSV